MHHVRTRAVVLLMALASALVAGCGDDGGQVATQEGGGPAQVELPADEPVLSAIAGDEEAWVLTQTGGEAAAEVITTTLWRAAPSGEATEVTTMDGSGWWLETNGTEVFVVSSGCPDQGPSCEPIGVARLWVATGSELVVDGLEVERTTEPGVDVAGHTIGMAGSDVWIGAGDRILRVDPTGEVVEDVARGDAGLVCAVGGQLVATRRPARPGAPEGTPPTMVEPTTSELDLMVLDDGRWRDVSIVGLGPAEDLECTPEGIEQISLDDPAVPVAFWTPDGDGFQPVAAGEVPSVGPGATPLVTHHGEVLVAGDDGQVLVRPPGTVGYTARPSVRAVEAESGWVLPDYDASPTLEFSCTPETGAERSPVVCEVAER